jgi:hypothetical protein
MRILFERPAEARSVIGNGHAVIVGDVPANAAEKRRW